MCVGGQWERKRKRERLTEREINIIFHEIFLHSHILMFICLEKKKYTETRECCMDGKGSELKSVPHRD